MPLSARNPITNTYAVEASGWGSDQSFFVEKCELEWNEETGKYLTLTRSLSPGSMIFLRLLLPTSPDRSSLPGSRLKGSNSSGWSKSSQTAVRKINRSRRKRR